MGFLQHLEGAHVGPASRVDCKLCKDLALDVGGSQRLGVDRRGTVGDHFELLLPLEVAIGLSWINYRPWYSDPLRKTSDQWSAGAIGPRYHRGDVCVRATHVSDWHPAANHDLSSTSTHSH